MPTVLRFAGLRVVIYPNDHGPVLRRPAAKNCSCVIAFDRSVTPSRSALRLAQPVKPFLHVIKLTLEIVDLATRAR